MYSVFFENVSEKFVLNGLKVQVMFVKYWDQGERRRGLNLIEINIQAGLGSRKLV